MNVNKFFFVIDVGNTELIIALIKNFKIFKTKRINIEIFRRNRKIFNYFKINNILKKEKKIKCIISCVVPRFNDFLTVNIDVFDK